MIVSLIKSLFSNAGIIGHTWDWNFPLYPEQFILHLKTFLYVWYPNLKGGMYSLYKAELPYWTILGAVSPLGGEILSHAVPLVLVLISVLSMMHALKYFFRAPVFWQITGGILYACSPFAYSRIIAGHMTILVGYALLPLILELFIRLLQGRYIRSFFMHTLLLSVLFSLASVHILFTLVSLFLMAFFSFLYPAKNFISYFRTVLPLACLILVLNAYWMMPIGYSIVSTGTIRVRTDETIMDEVVRRQGYFRSVSQNMLSIITGTIDPGLHTEYVYPVENIRLAFAVVSVAFSVLVFVPFITFTRSSDNNLTKFAAFSIVGLGIAAGSTNIIGLSFYEGLLHTVSQVFAPLSNPLRLSSIWYAGSAITAVSVLFLTERYVGRGKIILRFMTVCGVVVLTYPWWFRDIAEPVITESSQPLSLKVTKINSEDRRVYEDIASRDSTTRIAFLPPAFLSWPGETDRHIPWSTAYFPSSVFLQYPDQPLAHVITSELYSYNPINNLGKLFSLAAVSRIYYPRYDHFESYEEFIPGVKDYKPRVDQNLNMQHDISLSGSLFSHTDVYEVENSLPMMYTPDGVFGYSGHQTVLARYVAIPDMTQKPAFFNLSPHNGPVIDDWDAVSSEITRIKADVRADIPESVLNPGVRFLPESVFYPLVQYRENRMKKSLAGDPDESYSFAVRLLAKRIAELKLQEDISPHVSTVSQKQKEDLVALTRAIDGYVKTVDNSTTRINYRLLESEVILRSAYNTVNTLILENPGRQTSADYLDIRTTLDTLMPLIDSKIRRGHVVTLDEPGLYDILAATGSAIPISITIGTQRVAVDPVGQAGFTYLTSHTFEKGESYIDAELGQEQNIFAGFSRSVNTSDFAPAENGFLVFSGQMPRTYCTNPMPVNDQRSYAVSFRLRADGPPAEFSGSFSGADGLVRHIPMIRSVLSGAGWKSYSYSIVPDVTMDSVTLCFSIPASVGDISTYQLDALTVYQKNDMQWIVLKKNPRHRSVPEITFQRILPTRYIVTVKRVMDPFYLVLSESFSPDWKAYVIDQSNGSDDIPATHRYFSRLPDRKYEIGESEHFMVNAFSNAWKIERDGDYSVVIDFYPQSVYRIALVFSVLCWVGSGIYIMYCVMRRSERGMK